jgi:hypothetical protein
MESVCRAQTDTHYSPAFGTLLKKEPVAKFRFAGLPGTGEGRRLSLLPLAEWLILMKRDRAWRQCLEGHDLRLRREGKGQWRVTSCAIPLRRKRHPQSR